MILEKGDDCKRGCLRRVRCDTSDDNMLIKHDMVLRIATHEKAGKATQLRSCLLDGIGTDLSPEMPQPIQITFSSIEVIFE